MAAEWTNWSGSVTCRPRRIETPGNEEELVAIVRRAAAEGLSLRVAGKGHSFTPLCATDDVLLSLERLHGVESTDRAALRATVRGGTPIREFGPALADCGMALANQGDVDVQAIAGAISTGTHGTGVTLGSLSSQVHGLRIVTADGDVVEISHESDAEVLRAAAVSLGMLGVVSAVRLQLVPVYHLLEQVREEPIRECLDSLAERIAANRHFEFFWYPARDLAVTKTLNPVEGLDAVVASNLGTDENQKASDQGRVDLSWRIFPTERNNRFNEMEYSVPAARGVECFLEIREMMRRRHSEVTWPIEYRTIAADDLFLSPASGRATVAISIHQGATLPCAEFFADAEQVFLRHDGRPHWGKMHNLDARALRDRYPDWDRFQAVRRRFDPRDRMLNGYLRGLFGEI